MENIIIIGAGPAGISAALYAARGNMDPLIINTGIGSLAKSGEDRELLRTGAAAVRQRAFSKGVLPRQEHLEYGSWMTRLWEWVVLILLR